MLIDMLVYSAIKNNMKARFWSFYMAKPFRIGAIIFAISKHSYTSV